MGKGQNSELTNIIYSLFFICLSTTKEKIGKSLRRQGQRKNHSVSIFHFAVLRYDFSLA